MAVWDMISEERTTLVDALAALPDERWTQPTLCAGWTTTDVVGHILATTYITPPKFFVGLASSGFRFNTMVDKQLHQMINNKTPGELIDELRAQIPARTSPPGPTMAMLGETIVHGEDIFRSGGGYRDHPIEHVLALADFFKKSNLLIGAKKRITGVTLHATDAEWSYGSGPEAAGPAIALVMAMTGRQAPLDDLTGKGVAILRQRP